MKKLKCHCGAIEADVNVPKNFEKILRCNCSLCKRKGALMSMVKKAQRTGNYLTFFSIVNNVIKL